MKPAPESSMKFPGQGTLLEIEDGAQLQPEFDERGLIPCVTQEAAMLKVLMVGLMRPEALDLTLAAREAHYWSHDLTPAWTSHRTFWKKKRCPLSR